MAIVQALFDDPEAVRNGVQKLPRQFLENWAEDFLIEVRNHAHTERFLANTAPEVPGDEAAPGAKKYPKREELKPTPAPVAEPDKTEHSPGEQTLKTSLPDYGAPKEFLQKIGLTVRAAEKLFEIESENQQEKQDARLSTFAMIDDARLSIYDL